MVFDFNSDVAQEYGIYKNEKELEIAKYMSSINIAAGFHAGDPMSIKRALVFAAQNDISIGAHIGYPDIAGFGYRKMNLDPDEIEALVIYQIGAVASFAKACGLEIEHVRCHGAMYEFLNENEEFAKIVAHSIKKFNPWLNLIVGTPQIKQVLQSETGINCAYEITFEPSSSIRQIREMEIQPDTVHFNSIELAQRAREVIKPTPINFNRVGGQL